MRSRRCARAAATGANPGGVSRAAFERVRAYEPRVLVPGFEVGAFRRSALPVWPLLHAFAPGRDGLRVGPTREAPVADPGAERVVRAPAGNIPEVLGTHAPSRRFPAEVGLSSWMIGRVRAYDREFAITHDYDGLAEITTAVPGTLDPVTVEGPAPYRPNVFDDQPGGLLYG